ncbi:hypothetical protein DFH09DRAFT_1218100 [Mycena vulgaris]|nr:hypothetical protein DFH09DRAFT_1218100 [Mycena vulgaris]
MADTQTAQAPATIEINDALFCTHFKEVCTECAFDGREENDAFFGFDPIDRDGMEAPPAIVNKDGVYQCKKHALTGASMLFLLHPSPPSSLLPRSASTSSFLRRHPPPSPRPSVVHRADYRTTAGCNQCYGWKKQITRARTAAKKAGKK